tara:strand:+ start:14629 stop:15246 length:618 start_codon:yes stop_codon:yes gene_type:complete
MNKVETMNIDNLVKAGWNYKTDGTEEQINKLIKSIKYDDSAGVIAVRKLNDKYEVIDGNHRLEALQRIGWQQIQVENFGDISKAKAIIIARRRNHVWFDDDLKAFSDLIKNDVLPEIDTDTLKDILPDTPDEIDNLVNFGNFDWEEPIEKEPKDDDGKKTIVVKVDESVYQMWQDWVKWCAEQTDYKSEPEAFEYLIIEAKNGQK